VDGTLVKGSGEATVHSAHARSYSHAVSQILNQGQPIPRVADVLPRELYHGSTDGLILLRLARATLNGNASSSDSSSSGSGSYDHSSRLDDLFDCMYDYICELDPEEIGKYIAPLPGVIEQLNVLSTLKESVMCGLVTGNVEGIARKKMKAVGIYDTNALSPPCPSQKEWKGTQDIAFLGGFGSDYCSGNIDDLQYNHLDRGEQIAIAARRCQNILMQRKIGNGNEYDDDGSGDGNADGKVLKRLVHVGDAPADVLAAKWFSEQQQRQQQEEKHSICVGMVAVATGSYSAEELRTLAGETIPGVWEPVVLEKGMADSDFLKACGV
jgi:hypothetical protein